MGLTVEEVHPNHSAIRETPVVNRLVFPNDAIPKRHQVTNGRACAKELQKFPNGSTLALFPELDKQTGTLFRAGEKFVYIPLIESSSDGLVDRLNNGVLEERLLLSLRIEARNLTRARWK